MCEAGDAQRLRQTQHGEGNVAMVAIDLLDMAVFRLTLAPSQHHSPVGQEHGRTIPLNEKGTH
jgi:hypothetical protein